MNFNSYEFVLLFLPLTIVVYLWMGKQKNYQLSKISLLMASLFFYGIYEWKLLLFIVGDVCINYLFFLWIKKTRCKRASLMITIVLNLVPLIYFKYYNFMVDSINLMFETEFSIRELIVPLGISFITFQQIGFLLDTYHGETLNYSILEYALFICSFTHVTSGPIITHNQFFPELKNKNSYKVNWENMATGIYMFAMGLGKKVLIADVLGKAVDWGYANVSELNSISAFFVMIAYSLQIYYDFSGYCDMAMGIGKMLNLKLPVNFNSPYKAVNILEFWKRWHITLTNFLTRCLYIPLGGNRKGKKRTFINTMIVFLCSGIWHGASWTFVLWGFLHGCAMIINKRFYTTIEKIPRTICWMGTFIFINFSWILFRANSFTIFKKFIGALFLGGGELHSSICDNFIHLYGVHITMINESLFSWIYIGCVLIATIGCKNVQEKACNLKWNICSVFFTAIILILSVLSFSNVTTYIYSGF